MLFNKLSKMSDDTLQISSQAFTKSIKNANALRDATAASASYCVNSKTRIAAAKLQAAINEYVSAINSELSAVATEQAKRAPKKSKSEREM